MPLYDGLGLRIYRELMHRETSCAANWHVDYGPEALQKTPDPATMINLGKFSKRVSVPMPLDVQRTLFIRTAPLRTRRALHQLTLISLLSVLQSASSARRGVRSRQRSRGTRRRHTQR